MRLKASFEGDEAESGFDCEGEKTPGKQECQTTLAM
jgi:hypothetical protein